ncbi:MAG: glycosyltransferase family 4 protein [bacterium]|nr:glycosyltransferase family 4 protein [bacterium]
MRIALVTASFLPKVGGAEFVVHHLAQQWCEMGHDVRILNYAASEPSHPEARYSVRRYSVLRGASRFGAHRFPFRWHVARQLRRLLEEYQPEFISVHFGYPTAVWLSGVKPLPRYLVTCHGPALNETPQGPRQRFGIDRLVAGVLSASAGAVALSSDGRRIMERIGVNPGKILDIPNGVDLARFQTPVTDFDLRAHFGLPADARIVLTVGRITWAKAHDAGIKAFAKVHAKLPETHYIMLGKGVSKWQPLATDLGVASNVVFCNGLYDSELVGAYQQADIFFLPSVKELCPMVVPEAMGAGLPAVVTNISGSQDMVQTGDNGFVVEPGDVDAMAEALQDLLEDDALRTRMAQASSIKAQNYAWERVGRLYLEHA